MGHYIQGRIGMNKILIIPRLLPLQPPFNVPSNWVGNHTKTRDTVPCLRTAPHARCGVLGEGGVAEN
jgi:hypothetical protein